MPRDIGKFRPRRPKKMNHALMAMILNGINDIKKGNVFVLQVGAHDGKMDDPIFNTSQKYGWGGLLIEPHPAYFSDLETVYKDNEKVEIVNCGISSDEGTMPLYYLNEDARPAYPTWMRGCASLEKDRMLQAIEKSQVTGRDTDSDIAFTEINMRRLDNLLKERSVKSADIVVIDVEGHELSVMNSFNLKKLKVSAAIVECNGVNVEQEDEYVAALEKASLDVYRLNDDLVGLKPDAINIPIEDLLHFFGKSVHA